MRKSRRPNGRAGARLSIPNQGTGGDGGVLTEERDEFFPAQGAQGGAKSRNAKTVSVMRSATGTLAAGRVPLAATLASIHATAPPTR